MEQQSWKPSVAWSNRHRATVVGERKPDAVVMETNRDGNLSGSFQGSTNCGFELSQTCQVGRLWMCHFCGQVQRLSSTEYEVEF